jgi:hypothetical protein
LIVDPSSISVAANVSAWATAAPTILTFIGAVSPGRVDPAPQGGGLHDPGITPRRLTTRACGCS